MLLPVAVLVLVLVVLVVLVWLASGGEFLMDFEVCFVGIVFLVPLLLLLLLFLYLLACLLT